MAEQAIAPERRTVRLGMRNVPVAILAIAAAIFVLHEGASVLAPALLSVLLAYALEPFVVALMRLRLRRIVAAAILYVLLGASAVSGARSARAQVVGFLDDLPRTIVSMRHAIATARTRGGGPGAMDRIQEAGKELQASADATAPAPPATAARIVPVLGRFRLRDYLVGASLGLFGIGGEVFAIAVLTFLLITAGDLFKRKLIALAGPGLAERKLTLEVIKTIDRQIERYLVVRLVISGIVGAATAAAVWFVGLDHAPIWGLVAGALNIVPFIGPSAACAGIAAAAFLQFHALEPTLLAGSAAVAIAVLEGNLVSPWLTGRAVQLNTVAVFISVLFWGWAWDAWGLVLAVPIAVVMKAAADHIEPLQPLGELLGR